MLVHSSSEPLEHSSLVQEHSSLVLVHSTDQEGSRHRGGIFGTADGADRNEACSTDHSKVLEHSSLVQVHSRWAPEHSTSVQVHSRLALEHSSLVHRKDRSTDCA